MATSLGRVMMVFKGTYSSTTQYEKLDAVYYNGSSYVAKQSTKGNDPTNTTYWQILAKGSNSPGTVTSVATGAGLTGGPITNSGTIKADLKSETKSSLTAASKGSTSGREYAVGLDANGDLSVNVPWVSGSGESNPRSVGSSTNGVYFDSSGNAQPMSYSLNKSVPSNAVFTDTNYTPWGLTSGYVRTGQKSGTTIGSGATAEGYETEASGGRSHAEGFQTKASGNWSHAEGKNTIASSVASHAEGASTTASAGYAHAEGANTIASAEASHAEGADTTASGIYSHASGSNTTAGYANQFVCGKYNDNQSDSLFEVGNGTSTKRSNVFRIKNTGQAIIHADGASSESSLLLTKTNGSTSIRDVQVLVSSDNKLGFFDNTNNMWIFRSDPSGNSSIRTLNANNKRQYDFGLDSFFTLDADNVASLGFAGRCWKAVYAKNGNIQTSDKNRKNRIVPIDETLENIFLETPTYTFYFNDGDRRHIGTISQEIEELLDKYELSPMEFAPFCKDHIDTKTEIRGEGITEETITVDLPEEEQYDIYSFRYEEYIMLTVHMVQKLYKKVDEQQEEIDNLKERIVTLEKYIQQSFNQL